MGEQQQPKFTIGQAVDIAENGRTGTVIGYYVGRRGIDYDVIYSDTNGMVDSRYFHPEDISPV